MKKIVRGNDFTLRVPVRRIVNGEKESFPLPACEEIEVNLVNAFRRRRMAHTIGVEDDSLLEVSVHSSEMALGAYALEVKGKLFGRSWRSNEYEQIMLVDNNASGDTEFGETDEGEDSVEMDTAIVVLAPVTVIDGNFEVLIDEAVSESEKKTDTKLEELKNEIVNGVRDGAWLPLKRGRKSDGTFVDDCVAMGFQSEATGYGSTAMGYNCKALGNTAHAENAGCTASGDSSHAQGSCNYDDPSFIDMVGVGNYEINKNASAIYVKRNTGGNLDTSDPKNGYQYLIGVGGYQGQAIAEGTKSVQEVIADLTSRIEALEAKLADTTAKEDQQTN